MHLKVESCHNFLNVRPPMLPVLFVCLFVSSSYGCHLSSVLFGFSFLFIGVQRLPPDPGDPANEPEPPHPRCVHRHRCRSSDTSHYPCLGQPGLCTAAYRWHDESPGTSSGAGSNTYAW